MPLDFSAEAEPLDFSREAEPADGGADFSGQAEPLAPPQPYNPVDLRSDEEKRRFGPLPVDTPVQPPPSYESQIPAPQPPPPPNDPTDDELYAYEKPDIVGSAVTSAVRGVAQIAPDLLDLGAMVSQWGRRADFDMNGIVQEAQRAGPQALPGIRQEVQRQYGNTPRGLAIQSRLSDLEQFGEAPAPVPPIPLEQEPAHQAAQRTRQAIEQALPIPPEHQDRMLVRLAGGAGALSRNLAEAYLFAPALFVDLFGSAAANTMNDALRRNDITSTSDLGALSGAGPMPAPVDDATILRAAAEAGAVNTALMFAQVHQVLGPVYRNPGVAAWLSSVATKAIKDGAVFGGLNGVIQFADNLIAKINYAPDRALAEGVPRAVVEGAIMGGVAGGVRGALVEPLPPSRSYYPSGYRVPPEPAPPPAGLRGPAVIEGEARPTADFSGEAEPVPPSAPPPGAPPARDGTRATEEIPRVVQDQEQPENTPATAEQRQQLKAMGYQPEALERVSAAEAEQIIARHQTETAQDLRQRQAAEIDAWLGGQEPPAPDTGTRANVPVVRTADELDRVARQSVEHPLNPGEATDAQREAGNYQKAHAVLELGPDAVRLPVTIESPKGSIRRGIGDDHVQWEVRMPAHYGYVKRTEGADEEQVDVYVGPNLDSDRVWIVDQVAPKTGEFDEHKAMVGFPDRASAVSGYQMGFSDGSGPDRLGAVTEMSVPEFRAWLKKGETDKALTYVKPEPPAPEPPPEAKPSPPPRAPRPRAPQAGGDQNLLDFIASRGGIKPSGELRAMDLHRPRYGFRPGIGMVVRPGGLEPDMMREQLEQSGYLQPGSTEADLYNLIEGAVGRGRPERTADDAEEEQHHRDVLFVSEVRPEDLAPDQVEEYEAAVDRIERYGLDHDTIPEEERSGEPEIPSAAQEARPAAPGARPDERPPAEEPPGPPGGGARPPEAGAGEGAPPADLDRLIAEANRRLPEGWTIRHSGEAGAELVTPDGKRRVGVGQATAETVRQLVDQVPTYQRILAAEANEHWWDHELTPVGRRRVLTAAGVKRPDQVRWQHLSEPIREKLLANRAAADVDTTAAGQQGVIPGTDPLTDAQQAQQGTKKPLRPKAPQAAPGGIFDPGTHGQGELPTAPPPAEPPGEPPEGAPPAETAEGTFRRALERTGAAQHEGVSYRIVPVDINGAQGFAVEVTSRGARTTLGGAGVGGPWSQGQAINRAVQEAGFGATIAPEGDHGIQEPLPPSDARPGTGDVQSAPPVGPDERPPPSEIGGGAPAPGGAPQGQAPKPPRPRGPRGSKGGGGAGAGGDAGLPGEPEGPGGKAGAPAGPPPEVTGKDFTIKPGDLAEARGPTVKARDNLKAIELAERILDEGRLATVAEQETLARYVGWGGLANAFPNAKGAYAKGMEEIGQRLADLLTPEEYATARRSTQYAHYTAEHVIQSMWNAVAAMGFKGGSVLEPGMGVGHFKGLMPPDIAAASRYHGYEMDGITAAIARLLYPESGVTHADFTRTPLPDDHFDLAIGNPPFANIVISADPKYQARSFLLHDYFFAKSMDALRPGGVMAFVTSAGTMNKVEPAARIYLAERAEFLGGVRLPSTAFKRNAGTEVTTDILFFQKRAEPAEFKKGEAPPWTGTVLRKLPTREGGEEEIQVNKWFSEHPEMVLGEEGLFDELTARGRYGVRPREGQDLPAELREAIGRLPKGIIGEAGPPAPEIDLAAEQTKDGSYYIDKKSGEIMQYRSGAGRPVAKRGAGVEGGLTATQIAKIRELIPIRDALRTLFKHDLANDVAEGTKARAELNRVYDAFIAKNGPINKADFQYRRPSSAQAEGARKEAREDARASGAPWDEGSFDPTDMIAKGATLQALARARKEAREAAEKAGKPWDEGTFDPEDMPDIAIEKRPNIDPFYDDPESFRLRAIEDYDDATGKTAKKLIFYENILTKETEPQIKSANDGVLWSLNKYGRLDLDAIAKRLEKPRADVIEELGDAVYKLPGTDSYQVADEYLSGDVVTKLEEARRAAEADPTLERNVTALERVQPQPLGPSDITMTLGMPWIPPESIATFTDERLHLGKVKVRHVPAIGTWVVDKDTVTGPGYTEWGTSDVRASEILKHALNRTFPRVETWDEEARKKLFDPSATQAAVDKVVALKVAFDEWAKGDPARAEALAGLYNEKHNRIVPRRWDGEYLTTPGVASDWRWRPHQKRVVARIILTGSTYMAHAVGAGKTSAMIGAAMEMRRLGLVRKPMVAVPNHMLNQFATEWYQQYPLAKLMVADERKFHTSVRKQFIANVAQNDIDAVIITHSAFEKIPLGLDSQRAIIDEEIEAIEKALQGLDEVADKWSVKKLEAYKERLEQKLTAAGGDTDLVNTFEELGVDFLFVDEAHLFRKLDYATKLNIKGIDPEGSDRAWDLYTKIRHLDRQQPGRAAVLASGTPVTNTMAELFTIQRYLQTRDLRQLGLEHFDSWASSFGDTKAEMEPTASGGYKEQTRFAKFVNMYDLYRVVAKLMDVVTSEQLEQYVVRPKIAGGKDQLILAPRTPELVAYQEHLAARMAAIEARKRPPQKGDDIILSVIEDGRFAAIDLRYVNPLSRPDQPSKLNMMIDRVYDIWKESAHQQFYDPGSNYERPTTKGPATQMIFASLGVGSGGKRIFKTDDWIRRALVAKGVPREQIAFIKEYKGHADKLRLFNDMNAGKVRILVGSVQKMGVGVNAQRRLLAEHNLDPEWYPANHEQRKGRIYRQGNQNPEIRIFNYSTKGTYDAAMWGMMARKGRFIEQFFRGDPDLRDMEDLGEASIYEQAAAMSTTDERVIKLTEMRQELDKLYRRESAHEREAYSARQQIRQAESSVRWSRDVIAHYRNDIAQRQDLRGDNFRMTVEGRERATRKDAAAALQKTSQAAWPTLAKDGESTRIGAFSGFPLLLRRSFGGTPRFQMALSGDKDGSRTVDLTDGSTGMAGVIASAEALLRGFEDRIKGHEKKIAEYQETARQYQEQLGKPFTGGPAIEKLRTDIRQLETEIHSTKPPEVQFATGTPTEARVTPTVSGARVSRVEEGGEMAEPNWRGAMPAIRGRLQDTALDLFMDETGALGAPPPIKDSGGVRIQVGDRVRITSKTGNVNEATVLKTSGSRVVVQLDSGARTSFGKAAIASAPNRLLVTGRATGAPAAAAGGATPPSPPGAPPGGARPAPPPGGPPATLAPPPGGQPMGRRQTQLAIPPGGGPRQRAGAGSISPAGPRLPGVQAARAQQTPPQELGRMLGEARGFLSDVWRDLAMATSPMTQGSGRAMAWTTDWANRDRAARQRWAALDERLRAEFHPERRRIMFDAADAQSVARQVMGNAAGHATAQQVQGMVALYDNLPAREKRLLELLDRAGDFLWQRQQAVGMVQGMGLPQYTARLAVIVANNGEIGLPQGTRAKRGWLAPLDMLGVNFTTQGTQRRRHQTIEETEAAGKLKHGAGFEIVRDVRVLALALSRIERAVAGRELINEIKQAGTLGGQLLVTNNPPNRDDYFSLDHPAFMTWAPDIENGQVRRDSNGNIVFLPQRLWVAREFEGPLRAILTHKPGALYSALMRLKGGATSLIMYSPLIHLGVEWGRAFPLMPGKVFTLKAFFEGNAARNDPVQLNQAITVGGVVPMGKRGYLADLTSLAAEPQIKPGQSLIAKGAGALVGLIDRRAGELTRQGLDWVGDVWHNKMLWDRIFDLQMGIYVNIRQDLLNRGLPDFAASKVAGVLANRFAGALPNEAVSEIARKILNIALFSRLFTSGNIAVMKDSALGLPRNIMAQIEHQVGATPLLLGNVTEQAKRYARRRAQAAILKDIALLYGLNAVLENVFHWLGTGSGSAALAGAAAGGIAGAKYVGGKKGAALGAAAGAAAAALLASPFADGDQDIEEIVGGYWRRLVDLMHQGAENPWNIANPYSDLIALLPQGEHEPGKEQRIELPGSLADGTKIYLNNPTGKVGGEFLGWAGDSLEMAKRKMGTTVRPLYQVFANDQGFGRPVYDARASGITGRAKMLGEIAWHIMKSQTNSTFWDNVATIVKGDEGKPLARAQTLGPLFGLQFSKGYPGGPAAGTVADVNKQALEAQLQALPEIRKQIRAGDLDGALERMLQLGFDKYAIQRTFKVAIDPQTRLSKGKMRRFEEVATPEERARVNRLLERQAKQQPAAPP